MAEKFTYDYEKADITVDGVVFGYDPKSTSNSLKVLLIKRGNPTEPFYDCWAIPGGYVEIGKNESLGAAIRRELREETLLDLNYLEQLYTFGDPNRDPRGRVITVAYFALVRKEDFAVEGRDDAKEAAWVPINKILEGEYKLAFDHDEILSVAFSRLQGKVRYSPLGFNLLPEKFSLGQLRRLYEAILQRPLDKRNFRKRILAMGILTESGVSDKSKPGKATKLYSFDEAAYNLAVKNRFNFEI